MAIKVLVEERLSEEKIQTHLNDLKQTLIMSKAVVGNLIEEQKEYDQL